MTELLTLGRVRLTSSDGSDSATSGAQPKRIALLAYIALESAAAPVRRDALLALFWPELGEDEARRALRQGLHHLRRVVGDDVIVATGDELSLQEGAFQCDAAAFDRLFVESRFEDALALYRGDFFHSFHVDDVAPELEDWIWRTRARLKRRASTAAWAAADAAVAAGRSEDAIELGRHACELDADQEANWRRLMTLQDQLGDRAGALRTYDDLANRLQREFEAKPAAETSALAERIRTAKRMVAASDPAPLTAAPVGTPSDVTPAVETIPRSPRRRRRALTAVAAAIGIAIASGGYATYIKLSEVRDVPSLMSAGSLAARDRLVVADFSNLSGDSLLAQAITEAFRVDLSQSPLVRVMSPRQIAGALERMKRRPDTALSEPLAREVAEREGAKAIVTGSVANVAGAFMVSVQLMSAADGSVLTALRETASDSSELIAAVDRVSEQLRFRIGESLRSLRSEPPLAHEITASLAALRKYTEGRRLDLAGRRTEAIPFYEKAIELDTAFAAAYSGLAMTYDALAEPGRAEVARLRAIALRDRLPFFDRTFLLASHSYGANEYETAIDAYNRLLERYPDDIRILNNLALIYQDTHRFATAESLFTRAAAIDSTVANLYFGIHGDQLLQGKFRESRATLDLLARRFPNNPVRLTIEMQDASAQQHWEEAERQAETIIAAAAGDTLSLIDPYEALAGMAMAQGRLVESERLWKKQLALSAAAGSRGRHLFGLLQLARLHLRYHNAPARALALVDSALAATPLDSVLPGDRPYDDLARFYASAGRPARARELLAAAVRNDTVLVRTPGPDHGWTRGVIAMAEGRVSVAEAELRQAAEALVCTICALPDLARAYEAANKTGAAVTVYERYLVTPWFWRYETDATELGWAMKRLSELYTARREDAKASALRGRWRQLWRRADAELQIAAASEP